jgi:cholest-4-en-3-one 26-monooxygenase
VIDRLSCHVQRARDVSQTAVLAVLVDALTGRRQDAGNRPATAVDEIIRWASPVHCFQRTATADVELGGVTVREGQRVGLFYSSANFDEEVFENPFRFDILRNPNPHLSFGGNGAHYCIGANLARMEIKLVFDELANQLPDITKLAEPQRLRSGWINGVKRLDVAYGASAR